MVLSDTPLHPARTCGYASDVTTACAKPVDLRLVVDAKMQGLSGNLYESMENHGIDFAYRVTPS